MTVKKDRSSPENKQFWEAVAEASRTVESWPAWKRGESSCDAEPKPEAAQEPPDRED